MGNIQETFSTNEKTKEHIAKLGSYEIVEEACNKVSNKPLASFEFSNCKGIALFNRLYVSLAHIYSIGDSHPHHIDEMLQKMECCNEGLQAIVLARRKRELRKITDYCKNNGIAVVGQYQKPFYNAEFWRKKDMIVIPSTREVFIYTSKKTTVINFKPSFIS